MIDLVSGSVYIMGCPFYNGRHVSYHALNRWDVPDVMGYVAERGSRALKMAFNDNYLLLRINRGLRSAVLSLPISIVL